MRFIRTGAVAIDPKAYGPHGVDYKYDTAAEAGFEMLSSDLAYLTIRGPMSHHPEWYFESYDELLAKFANVCKSGAKICFVSGDTPGGDVSGCFDGARQLRTMMQAAGIMLVWYVDGQTCSAGLAWAMAADVVVVPPEGRFGSIGVIAELTSYKKQAEAYGQETELITSGTRKADGHPLNDISKDTIAAVRNSVEYEANLFFEWVSERRDIPVETIRSWQAGIFHGQEAVDAGLADEVAGESAALAMCAGVELTEAPLGAENGDDMSAQSLAASAQRALGIKPNKASVASRAEDGDDFDAVKKKLGKIASGDDAKKAKRAADMLKKMAEDSEEESAEDEEPKPEKKNDEEPDGDEGSAEDESDDASASAAESEDDASSAEDEEASAKKCEDDAKKASADADEEDAKARTALASGAKDCAKVASRHLARASSLRSQSKTLRREAKSHRSMAAIKGVIVAQAKHLDKITKAIAKAGTANPSTAAIAARGTQGTPAKPPTPSAKDSAKTGDELDVFTPAERHALGLVPTSSAVVQFEGQTLLGLPSPEQAAAVVKATQARVAELKGGSN